MATKQLSSFDNELKEPLNSDASGQDTPQTQLNVIHESHAISFKNMIPYNKPLVSDALLNDMFPFLSASNAPLNLWRTKFIVGFVICLLCALNTTVQLWFILAAPSPYRWISLGFFILTQMISVSILIIGCWYLGDEEISSIAACALCFIVFVAFPMIPLWVFIFVRWLNDDDNLGQERDFLKSTLWIQCFGVHAIAIFQAFPQLIVMVIMFSQYGFSLHFDITDVMNWSFWSSILVMLSWCIILVSILEGTAVFVLNTIWLWLDYAIFLFILSAVFYDNNGLNMFIIDVSSTILPFYLFPVGATIFNFITEDDRNWKDAAILCGLLCVVALLTPLILFLLGPFTFSIFYFFSVYFDCNIFPVCLNFAEVKYDEFESYWYKYRMLKWIKYGNNNEERDMRLSCINMVILDAYYPSKFVDLKQEMAKHIRTSMYFGKKCAKAVSKSDHSKYKLNLYVQVETDEDVIGNKYMINVLHIYVITRVLHLMMPIAIGVYIGYKENWKLDNINFMIKYLGFGIVILSLFCIICFIHFWISTHYHRMIIPFNKGETNRDFAKYASQIATCYTCIIMGRIITDCVGNRDIANIIIQYMISIELTGTIYDAEEQ